MITHVKRVVMVKPVFGPSSGGDDMALVPVPPWCTHGQGGQAGNNTAEQAGAPCGLHV